MGNVLDFYHQPEGLNNCLHGESTYKRTSSAWICTLYIPTQWWEDIVCTICTAAISPAQYTIESRRSLKKKSIPLTVQPMEGAVVRKTTLLLFHMKRFLVRTLGEVNSLYSLRYLQNDFYTILYKASWKIAISYLLMFLYLLMVSVFLSIPGFIIKRSKNPKFHPVHISVAFIDKGGGEGIMDIILVE